MANKGRPLSEEQKQRMAEGRRRAAAEKRERAAAQPTAEDVIAGRVEMPRQQFEMPDAEAPSYALFLAGLDAETCEVLSDAELRQIFAAQRARAQEERRAAKRKAATDRALHVARMGAGLVSASTAEALAVQRRNSQLTRLRIELPPTGENGEIPDVGLRVDQRIFAHGAEYTVTEGQAASMREAMYRIADMQLLFEGRNKRARAWMMSRATLSNGMMAHIELTPDGSVTR